jgi:hypothetical protein
VSVPRLAAWGCPPGAPAKACTPRVRRATVTFIPAASTSAVSVQVPGFDDSGLLTHGDRLVCDSCSSDQCFAFGFLQIPPHDGHPCRSANRSPCRAGRGLSPPSRPGRPPQRAGTAPVKALRTMPGAPQKTMPRLDVGCGDNGRGSAAPAFPNSPLSMAKLVARFVAASIVDPRPGSTADPGCRRRAQVLREASPIASQFVAVYSLARCFFSSCSASFRVR